MLARLINLSASRNTLTNFSYKMLEN
ncbi:hypothetical protein DFAR_940019 [Desulfarculales bacterium]